MEVCVFIQNIEITRTFTKSELIIDQNHEKSYFLNRCEISYTTIPIQIKILTNAIDSGRQSIGPSVQSHPSAKVIEIDPDI